MLKWMGCGVCGWGQPHGRATASPGKRADVKSFLRGGGNEGVVVWTEGCPRDDTSSRVSDLLVNKLSGLRAAEWVPSTHGGWWGIQDQNHVCMQLWNPERLFFLFHYLSWSKIRANIPPPSSCFLLQFTKNTQEEDLLKLIHFNIA